MTAIGKSIIRVDARGKVTGKTLYSGDLSAENQLFLKILFADRPHAVVKKVDTSKAEALPGVAAVYTAADVPVNEYGLQIPDQPVLCGPGSGKEYADRVRFVGDQVAAVVAENEKTASQALKLIEVEYQDLPLVLDPLEAVKEGAELLHPDQGTNVMESFRIRKGDVDQAFQECAVIVEGEYHTPAQEHAYLQPEAGMAYIDDQGRVTVAVGGQWAHEEQEQIAHALGLEQDQVRVIHPAVGGAFGGREDISIQILLGLAALDLHQRGINRPVKTVWSREESIIGHHKRHPYRIKARWGADREGKILAAEVDVTSDGGAYMYTSNKVLGNTTLMCTGPYEIPHVKVDTRAVYTNKVPGGAFRGFGGPQGAYAAECQINKLAEALDLEPVEIALRNILREGSLMSVQTPLPGAVSLPEVVERCAEESFWDQTPDGWRRMDRPREGAQPYLKRGIGFACGFKNVGFSLGYQENSWAAVELYGKAEIEEVIVRQAATEVGQGAHTAIVQMTAEAVGVSPEIVRLVGEDTAEAGDSGSVSASRMTFMAGNSVIGAAKKALKKWKDEERPAKADYTYLAPPTTDFDPETGESKPNFAYGYVAQAVEVEVDVETGAIEVLEFISVNDVGKAINPDLVEGQIEGGVVQALGYALTENFIQEEGRVMTDKLSTYLIPTVRDVPAEVRSVIIEDADENGPFGARGMAEMPFIPVAPAVTAAVHDAIGVWIDEFPLTPERVIRALGKI
ncbi:MAG: xanthine dehydrogenase family protein molybdopterin-binding subunit [Anaerolineales bacterium]|nr:xanthine dehydrogenase family protein molybdopterin-binding subunit [Anaerolineales bacterium]